MLPIRKVVLYKHGVGYFERHGEFDGDAEVSLHFKAAEMNDVLKSLTTLDLDGGLISSVSYESTKPLEKRLEDIAIRLPDKNALTGLLAQIKGARVAVELGARKVEGIVIGIETVERGAGDSVLHASYLSLLVDDAAVQSFDLIEVKSLVLLDESLRKDLQHLLDVLISGKKKDLKKLTIFGKGSGKRRLLASYTVETPVWKTSYRILLAGAATRLQGWALVDNTQEEDWDDVSLSLVAGLPISFVHDLYSPRYKRRPVVKVQEEEAYAPPLIETSTVLSALEEPATLGSGRKLGAARSLAAAEAASMDVGATFGDFSAGDRSAARERSVQVQTRTVEVGDQFQYRIGNPVTVKRNQSALVPILHTSLEGRRVAIYNPEVRAKNPMSAVQLRNTTGLTLEGGPVTVLDDEQYVGESMLETMKPDEERLVPYSVELGCVVTVDDHSETRDVHFSRIAGGKLHLHRYRVRRKIYVILNKTERKLDLFLEHRFAPGSDLADTPAPADKTDHYYRFRLDVAPRSTVKFVVNEKGEEFEALAVHNANRDQLRFWFESKYIDAGTRQALEECIQLYEKAAALLRRIQERDKEVGEIFQDQERLRKNLQALGSSLDEKGLRERYVADLSKDEDKVAQYRTEMKSMREEKDKLEEDLRARLGRLKFEATL
jgi:hypothetical protein